MLRLPLDMCFVDPPYKMYQYWQRMEPWRLKHVGRNSVNKVVFVGFLGTIATSVHEYEQDKSICKYLILFRNEVIIILHM
jgi:hypothetical protein